MTPEEYRRFLASVEAMNKRLDELIAAREAELLRYTTSSTSFVDIDIAHSGFRGWLQRRAFDMRQVWRKFRKLF